MNSIEKLFVEPPSRVDRADISDPPSQSRVIIGRMVVLDPSDPEAYNNFLARIPGDEPYRITNHYGAPYVTLTLGKWARQNTEEQATEMSRGSLANPRGFQLGEGQVIDAHPTKRGKWDLRTDLTTSVKSIIDERRRLYVASVGQKPRQFEYFRVARLHFGRIEMPTSTSEVVALTRIERVATLLSQTLAGQDLAFGPATHLRHVPKQTA